MLDFIYYTQVWFEKPRFVHARFLEDAVYGVA